MQNLSYLEISSQNLIHNFNQFRKYLPEHTKLASVVKANAYGHGIKEVTQILEPYTDFFQVDDIEELIQIRQFTKKPVLVLGYVAKDQLEQVVNLNGTMAIYDTERLEILNQIGKDQIKIIPIHIKIDAAFGRQGILIEDLPSFFSTLKNCSNIKVEGVYSHFANIKDITDPTAGTHDFEHAQKQIDIFNQAVSQFRKNGFSDLYTHISATAGTVVYEKNIGQNTLARIGCALYGLSPSKNLQIKMEQQNIILKPVLRWITHIAQVKTLPENSTIGYGLTYITTRPTTIAVIPQGYSDGYDRGLSNIGSVIINGQYCKILGRISMNMMVVDVTHIPNVRSENEVVLLGAQNNRSITPEELADKLDTINYEITARINPLLPRIIV
jgi:alanine racemase